MRFGGSPSQSSGPRRRLESLLDESWRLYRAFECDSCLVRPSIPILYFGDRTRYFDSEPRVITVGLNPSKLEFPQEAPFRRFPAALAALKNGRIAHDRHVEALDGYLRAEPYTRWFDRAFEAMLNGLGCSYYDGRSSTALHTDLCSPLATDPTWSRLSRDQ